MDVSVANPCDRKARLEARDGGAVAGVLLGRFPHPELFIADRIEIAPGADADAVLAGFARAVAAALSTTGGEVLVVETGASPPWRAALETHGFSAVRRKVCVRRSLEGALPPPLAEATLRTLADAGADLFVARMLAASEGDPFEERKAGPRDPAREWRELLSSAGDRFDATAWLVAEDAVGPIGVVLPQAVNSETGTLFYVGVERSRRGRGFGRALHATGLERLRARGLARYVGSTDVHNAPMRRVFERNGCPVTETEVYLALAAR